MALNIKNLEAEELAGEVARLTGESKTQAVRRALEERKARLEMRQLGESRAARLQRFLTAEAWPAVPAEELGRRLTKDEEEALLGFGDTGFGDTGLGDTGLGDTGLGDASPGEAGV